MEQLLKSNFVEVDELLSNFLKCLYLLGIFCCDSVFKFQPDLSEIMFTLTVM